MTTINQKLVVQKTISPVDGSVYVERPLANCEEINDRKLIFIDAKKTIPAGTEHVYD